MSDRKPPRLWPGLALLALLGVVRFVVPMLAPSSAPIAIMSSMGLALLLFGWWLFFSRLPWRDRLLGFASMIALPWAASFALHPSIANAGQGFLFPIFVIPGLCIALVLGARFGRTALVVALVIASGTWLLLRTDGVRGAGGSQLAWRWSPTAEMRLLAEEERSTGRAGMATGEAEWPGFRGVRRDGVAVASRIATDWKVDPPVEIWRRAVGPGWSSIALHGGRLYTQEQRGEEESVTCYSAANGELIWRQSYEGRFWEANAGAGPRGTPTLDGDRLYALGALGRLSALDAMSGEVVWSVDAAAATTAELPIWGFSGSPLVLGDRVIAPLSGALVAYDRESGVLLWVDDEPGEGYASPHLASDGRLLFQNAAGLHAFDPQTGERRWSHAWDGYPIVQPAELPNGDLLVAANASSGLRRLDRTGNELWTSRGLKPYFNDFVVHDGHAYGFDGGILAAIDLETGERRWKGGRYGTGQMVLLPDQDLLLVIGESGELAVVEAKPDGFLELAKLDALEGKSWSHPTLVGDQLFLRNDREMVAYRLARSSAVAVASSR